MIPKLYHSTETTFASNGLGGLSDVISCQVEEEINGPYELTMRYPANGLHAKDLIEGNIIMAAHDSSGDLQPFRIYRRTDAIDGLFTISARHLSYDLNRIPVMPYISTTPAQAIQGLKDNAAIVCPFDFYTNIVSAPVNYYWVNEPQSIRSVLCGGAAPMTDYWHCELMFDRFSVYVLTRRGVDKDIAIRYGVNMTGLEVASESREGFNSILPFFKRGEAADIVYCDPPIITVHDEYDLSGVMVLDLSDKFDSEPTQNQLEAAANNWLDENEPWITEKSITVSFVDLSKTEDYKDIIPVQSLALGDSVMVYHARIGWGTRFRLMRAIYDVLRNRYVETTLGRPPETLSDIIAKTNKTVKNLNNVVVWENRQA